MTTSVMNQTRPATATCAHCKRTFNRSDWPGADVLQTELPGLGLQKPAQHPEVKTLRHRLV